MTNPERKRRAACLTQPLPVPSRVPDPNTLALPDFFTHLAADGHIRRLLELARAEDLGPPPPAGLGDITSLVTVQDRRETAAHLVAREAGCISGLRLIPMLLDVFAPAGHIAADIRAADGDRVAAGTTLAILRGRERDLLTLERTLLNIIGRLSGIATRTAAFVKLVEGTRARILDTRKTTPGLRALEKYAARCGGGHSHRLGLYDAVLIKDNHLAHVPLDQVAEVVTTAVKRAQAIAIERGLELSFIECEVDRLDQFDAILRAGGCDLDIVLLDNMSLDDMRTAVRMRNDLVDGLLLEASGGVNERTVRNIAETGIDRISIGGLTHHAVNLDVALDIQQ
jgi:nicotinate-nucleotide pyrophosphorylase (carboxylating)